MRVVGHLDSLVKTFCFLVAPDVLSVIPASRCFVFVLYVVLMFAPID